MSQITKITLSTEIPMTTANLALLSQAAAVVEKCKQELADLGVPVESGTSTYAPRTTSKKAAPAAEQPAAAE